MKPFNVYYKYTLGPKSFECILADTIEDAEKQFKSMYPDRIVIEVTRPRPGAR
jgi:hypothetical protein